MKTGFPNQFRIFIILLILLIPQPTFALGGSEALWTTIFGAFIVGVFLILSLLPLLSYTLIKNGKIIWIVITIILCLTGIIFPLLISWVFFREGGLGGIWFIIFILSSSVYFLIFYNTLSKIIDIRDRQYNDKFIDRDVDLETANNKIEGSDLILYQKFFNEDEAMKLTDLLKYNNIDYQLENHSPIADIIFSPSEHEKEYWLKLKKQDFESADSIYLEYLNSIIETIDREYYLFTLSTPELVEIINNPNEWSKLDLLLAKKILKDYES